MTLLKGRLKGEKMARTFDIPVWYHSPMLAAIKQAGQIMDLRKRSLSPVVLDFGPVRCKLARHFGFCFGVENAIEMAYRALSDHPHQRVFLLSEMIHNPRVNADLRQRGVRFLCDTAGKPLIPFDVLTPHDVVIVPAFGATPEVRAALQRRGVDPYAYDTTCPFVEKVWRKSREIGARGYTVIIHGKAAHEETRVTFTQAAAVAPVVVVRDLAEAHQVAKTIRGEASRGVFLATFAGRHSPGFDPDRHLQRIGVVNQTTMIATETQAVIEVLRRTLRDRYGEAHLEEHFADTQDTLCYATKENQDAVLALIEAGGDLAVVVGGHNSSNTSHLVAICAQKMPTYFVRDADDLLSPTRIRHLDVHTHTLCETVDWLPMPPADGRPVDVVLTAGVSSPDSALEAVVRKIAAAFPDTRSFEAVLAPYYAAAAEASRRGAESKAR
jgi:4-hydroxy-3-methylbut-2-enyl diphosphate reductase